VCAETCISKGPECLCTNKQLDRLTKGYKQPGPERCTVKHKWLIPEHVQFNICMLWHAPENAASEQSHALAVGPFMQGQIYNLSLAKMRQLAWQDGTLSLRSTCINALAEQPLYPGKLLMHCTLRLATPAAMWHACDSCDMHDSFQYSDDPFQHCASTVELAQNILCYMCWVPRLWQVRCELFADLSLL